MMLKGFVLPFALAMGDAGTYAPFSPEAWAEAGKMTLLGMVMVFAVLGVLWAVLSVFKMVFVGKTPSEKAPKKRVIEAEDKAITVIPEPGAAPYAQHNDDAQLIAVITAAVAAYMAEEGTEYAGGFRVVSFKRVRGGRTWNSK